LNAFYGWIENNVTPYETKLRLQQLARRKRLPGGPHLVGDINVDGVETPVGMIRFTVVFQDGLGTSLLMRPDDLRAVVAALPDAVKAIDIDPHNVEDVARARRIIYKLDGMRR
jgi:hypothetical protein